VLAIGERTFLPVVIPAAPANTILPRLSGEAGKVLQALGIDSPSIERELAEMGTITLARTTSRQARETSAWYR